MLNDLGNGLGERYARGGQLADLEAAIEVVQEALEVTAADDPNRPAMLSNVASGLRELYDQSGAATDLDACIAACEKALEAAPAAISARSAVLSNLGTCVDATVCPHRGPADLDGSDRASPGGAGGHPRRMHPTGRAILSNLGNRSARALRPSRATADLDAAITAFEEAVETTPADAADRPGYLSNLGTGLRDRYAHTAVPWRPRGGDRRLTGRRSSHTGRASRSPGYLNNLGLACTTATTAAGAPPTSRRPSRPSKRQSRRTPADAPPTGRCTSSNLGTGLRARYTRTGMPADLEAAIAAYRQAVEASRSMPPDGRAASRTWGLV